MNIEISADPRLAETHTPLVQQFWPEASVLRTRYLTPDPAILLEWSLDKAGAFFKPRHRLVVTLENASATLQPDGSFAFLADRRAISITCIECTFSPYTEHGRISLRTSTEKLASPEAFAALLTELQILQQAAA